MSTKRGNTHRTRPQKYQNHFAFKNSLHDTSKRTKVINSIQVNNTCERCKKIIEWKIKYKKYKPLKTPGKCNKCEKKTVKHAYHTMCGVCAKERKVCPKCGNQFEQSILQPSKEEELKLENEIQELLKKLPERKRRTFIRYMNKQKQINEHNDSNDKDKDGNKNSEICTKEKESIEEYTLNHTLNKLKSLVINDEDDNNTSSDCSNEDSEFDSECDSEVD